MFGSVNLQPMLLKTAPLASVMRVGDFQALSVTASCLEFGPNDCTVVLKPRHGYVPKVLFNPFRAQVITLLVLPVADGELGPNQVCPEQALRVYVEHSGFFRHSEQLFVCFGGAPRDCRS